MQSPINIDSNSALYSSNLGPFAFNGHNQTATWNVTNTGDTIKATLTNKTITLGGSDFTETYSLKQFHFHWGIKLIIFLYPVKLL